MKASEREGKGNEEECAKRVRVGDACVSPRRLLDPPAFILTSLPFYGLPITVYPSITMQYAIENKGLLVQPKFFLIIKSYGYRLFSHIAPSMSLIDQVGYSKLNALPDQLRTCTSLTSFKSKVRAHLSKSIYKQFQLKCIYLAYLTN